MKLIDALSIVNGKRNGLPEPFSIEFYNMNVSKGTGGEIMKLDKQVGSGSNHDPMKNGTVTVKNANNMGHPTPVHIRNIITINGERVFW